MTTSLLSIGTANPTARLSQTNTRDFFASQPGVSRLTARLIGAAFDQSQIDTRYSVIGGIGEGPSLFTDDGAVLATPSTGARNLLYRQKAPALCAQASIEALTQAGVNTEQVTHVITASCTGFFAPGPDYLLVRELGLSPSVERYHIGFMGCGAAFPALRAATRICDAQPGSVVLVVCVELCSLHIRSSADPEQIVASAVFGDGVAAAVVSSRTELHGGEHFEIGPFATTLTTEGEEDMDWTIGDLGFDMRLTAEVPRIIGREIEGAVSGMLGESLSVSDVDEWAVHPGGRSILDRVQEGLGLSDEAMLHSREVLLDFGNMSSATILFVLKRIIDSNRLAEGSRVAALGFGPGLTVETALFERREG